MAPGYFRLEDMGFRHTEAGMEVDPMAKSVNTIDAPLDTPGSPSAVLKGCMCPVEDNQHGQGYRPPHRNGGGAAIFWIDDSCQLHAPKTAGEILEKLSQPGRPRTSADG